jgi:hypothetical protein
VGSVEKMQLEQAAAKHGLTVVTAALFLGSILQNSISAENFSYKFSLPKNNIINLCEIHGQ